MNTSKPDSTEVAIIFSSGRVSYRSLPNTALGRANYTKQLDIGNIVSIWHDTSDLASTNGVATKLFEDWLPEGVALRGIVYISCVDKVVTRLLTLPFFQNPRNREKWEADLTENQLKAITTKTAKLDQKYQNLLANAVFEWEKADIEDPVLDIAITHFVYEVFDVAYHQGVESNNPQYALLEDSDQLQNDFVQLPKNRAILIEYMYDGTRTTQLLRYIYLKRK